MRRAYLQVKKILEKVIVDPLSQLLGKVIILAKDLQDKELE